MKVPIRRISALLALSTCVEILASSSNLVLAQCAPPALLCLDQPGLGNFAGPMAGSTPQMIVKPSSPPATNNNGLTITTSGKVNGSTPVYTNSSGPSVVPLSHVAAPSVSRPLTSSPLAPTNVAPPIAADLSISPSGNVVVRDSGARNGSSQTYRPTYRPPPQVYVPVYAPLRTEDFAISGSTPPVLQQREKKIVKPSYQPFYNLAPELPSYESRSAIPTAPIATSGLYAPSISPQSRPATLLDPAELGRVPASVAGRPDFGAGSSIAAQTVKGIPKATKDVSIGLAQGAFDAAVSTAEGLGTAAAHPVKTVKSVVGTAINIVSDPANAYASAKEQLIAAKDIVSSGDGRAIGRMLGQTYFLVGTSVVGGGSGSGAKAAAVSRAANVARGAEEVVPLAQFARTTPTTAPLIDPIWKLDPLTRGRMLEDIRGVDPGLKANAKVIDKFSDGNAISRKSVDLDSPTYQNVSALRNRLFAAINDLADYKGGSYAEFQILPSQIKNRTLDLVVPHLGTPAQLKTLNELVDYAKTRGVEFDVVVY